MAELGFKIDKPDHGKVGRMEGTLMARLKGKALSAGARVLAKTLGIPHAAFSGDLIAVARK